MPAIHETAYPQLKRQPRADELARLYSPTCAERELAIQQTKGPVARIGFLVMLKTFQRLGYFVRLAEVPEPIVTHLIACLDVPLTVADLHDYDTSGTQLRHLAAIRAYRQVKPYMRAVHRLLIRTLVEVAPTKTDLVDLINIGIEELVRLRYELPAFAPLCRLARHARAVVHRGIYRRVQVLLTPAVCVQLDQLLVADPSTKHTPWHALKRDPGTPTLAHGGARTGEACDAVGCAAGRPHGTGAGRRGRDVHQADGEHPSQSQGRVGGLPCGPSSAHR